MAKHINTTPESLNHLHDDLYRMQRICASHGWVIDFEELAAIWRAESTKDVEDWLTLPSDSEALWVMLNNYLEE